MDRLTRQNDSLRSLVQQVDTAALDHMQAIFNSDRNNIEQRFADTLTTAEAETLGNYHRLMAIALPRVLHDRDVLHATLDSTGTRLWQLHHDVEHALHKAEEESRHVAQEQARALRLKQATTDLLARVEVVQRDHAHYRPAAERLLHRTAPTP